jgi:hypothetical protein
MALSLKIGYSEQYIMDSFGSLPSHYTEHLHDSFMTASLAPLGRFITTNWQGDISVVSN